ncbi:hypothetical protein ONE63_001407 [Megalurothrips usitatus]|uniref:Saposin A-type domain-containing protein n=1 Tax=Megalurothrips usitatus TaxID=439358 RepID=A0AAV7XGE6_9NEOP|nr:hypothetical protein ONE63_001407 [Megalurothrips usitatus]
MKFLVVLLALFAVLLGSASAGGIGGSPHLVGGNPCTWGPTSICKSAELRKKCNIPATTCQQRGWSLH